MMLKKIIVIIIFTGFSSVLALPLFGQRQYAPNSVLAKGLWYKFSITKEGIYKVDLRSLSKLGINSKNLASSSLRLFGNGGAMLEEDNNVVRPDDLIENPIEMFDGGDGVFNGNDYFLFYAPGPDRWNKDSFNHKFYHQKNFYTDTCYYYLTIGSQGSRIETISYRGSPNLNVQTYDERFFHENNQYSLINSGKEWFGELFGYNNLTLNFSIPILGLVQNQPLWIRSKFAVRGFQGSSQFLININGNEVQRLNLDPLSGSLLDAYAVSDTATTSFHCSSANLDMKINFVPSSFTTLGWLDWFEINCRRSLSMNDQNQLSFRDWKSVGTGNVSKFNIENIDQTTEVWDITDPIHPQKMLLIQSGDKGYFVNQSSQLKEYMAFKKTGLLSPEPIGRIANQDLHNSNSADFIIIAPNAFLAQANQLASFHRQYYGQRTVVAETEQIYNEFGGGQPSPVAIRDFVKMYYDKAKGTSIVPHMSLLLFGGGSFDPKNRIAGNTNYIPCYESKNSLSDLLSYTSDDFYGLLGDNDNINSLTRENYLAFSVGRLPVRNILEAKNVVNKIIQYHSNQTLGAWKNNTIYVADDKDENIFIRDAETISSSIDSISTAFNKSKIYLDAYTLVPGNVQMYPMVNHDIVSQLNNGCWLVNYSGHGNYLQLSGRSIFTQVDADQLNNSNKLPLIVAATCDFVPYDDPTKSSLGAYLLDGGRNGAIALLSAPRLVDAGGNEEINNNFVKELLAKNTLSQYQTIGESFRLAKNGLYKSSSDILNIRKFALIGDPAIRISFPRYNIKLTTINHKSITETDTIKAFNKYSIEGEITDESGNILNNFNGKVYTNFFNTPKTIQTLGNDPASPVTKFYQQTNSIFKGEDTVTNGKFSFTFIGPKDIIYQVGKTTINLYAENGITDANGSDTSFYLAGSFDSVKNNYGAPLIESFINNFQFRNGDKVNGNLILLVKLYDSLGINLTDNKLGHNITASIDGDDLHPLILNQYYKPDIGSYQNGTIAFPLTSLSEGKHTIKIIAWNILDISTKEELAFVVVKSKTLQITNLFNYPNPFRASTTFSFLQNQFSHTLQIYVTIYTTDGKEVQQIYQVINQADDLVNVISWDGRDFKGNLLPDGIYFYRVDVSNSDGQKGYSAQRLLIAH